MSKAISEPPQHLPGPGELILYTLPPSHFSEKARWALDRARLPYREHSDPPLLHRLVNLWLGARTTTRPVLKTSAGLLCDSAEILQYIDAFLPPESRLYPVESDLRRQVCDLEQHLGKEVGFSVIRWAYFHLLPVTELIVPVMTGPSENLENRLFRWLFPAVRLLMQKGLKLSPANAGRAQQNLERTMDEIAHQLSDGRRYLLGDRFTAADLTCAALYGPVLIVPEYGGTRASIDLLPPAAQECRQNWLSHPTGQFVQRLYREHRPPRGGLPR